MITALNDDYKYHWMVNTKQCSFKTKHKKQISKLSVAGNWALRLFWVLRVKFAIVENDIPVLFEISIIIKGWDFATKDERWF